MSMSQFSSKKTEEQGISIQSLIEKREKVSVQSVCSSAYLPSSNAEAADHVHGYGGGLAGVLDPVPHCVPAPPAGPESSPHAKCGFEYLKQLRMMQLCLGGHYPGHLCQNVGMC